jgi:methylmalonyl-CoA/ethylmalonyl-CoA epimerase
MRGHMRVRDVHHIGHAVDDLDAAVALYGRLLDADCEHRATVPDQGVEAASMRVGASRIELLAPTEEDSPVGRFLARRGPGMHHVAYRVDDVGAALRDAAEAGAELIDARPRPGLFGLQVAFVHPDSVAGVLVELVEPIGEAEGG